MSPSGKQIMALLLEGRKDAAMRLLDDSEGDSVGEAESEVLKASISALEAFSPKTQVQDLMLRALPPAFRENGSVVAQIRENLRLAVDLDRKWKPLVGDLLMDLVTRQLRCNAERGESVHLLYDTTFSTPSCGCFAAEKRPSQESLDGVVIGGADIIPGSTNLSPDALFAIRLLHKQRDRCSDFLLGGTWCDLFKLADELSPGAVARHKASLAEVERAFAGNGLYTSALLVRRCASGTQPDTDLSAYLQGVAALKSYAAETTEPSHIQHLAIALAYWVDAHPTQRGAAGSQGNKDVTHLLEMISTRGAWCDAVVIAQHFGFVDVKLTPSPRAYPWRNPATNHQMYLAALAQEDGVESRQQLERAAALGHAEAMLQLAKRLERAPSGGSGKAEVLGWYQKAAQAGLPEAQGRLGQMYECGLLVKQSAPSALYHYRQAANAGLAVSLSDAARIYLNSWATPEATNLFVALNGQAAAAGSAVAMHQLAAHFLARQGAETDQRAFCLLQEASRRAYAPAQLSLAFCYRNGRGTAPDQVRAFEFTLAAASNGSPAAMFEAAVAYQNGTGTTPDNERKEAWLRKAFEAGDPDAAQIYRQREASLQRQIAAMARQSTVFSANARAEANRSEQMRLLAQQAEIEAEERSRQLREQAYADAQERTARAMRRYMQTQLPTQAAQGVNYWRRPR